ncbi:MAG: hypothetical protein IKM39_02735 [Clostridia bacterium]|nr:hypothetical protein [Clostridia bacterium]
MNNDREIDAIDALQILRYAVGLIDKFPVEELLPETSTNVTQTDTPLGA